MAVPGCGQSISNQSSRKWWRHSRSDYRSNQLGAQGGLPDKHVIVVDGVLYVNRMLNEMIMVSCHYAEGKNNPITGKPYTLEERDEIIEMRQQYRMIPHGRIDTDGHQRLSYPDPSTYVAYDPVTQRFSTDIPKGKITIGLDPRIIKHLQKYPWQTPEWKFAYGQRNQVESSNKILKDNELGNLGDPKSRTARGFAYTCLVATFASIAANYRRIINGIITMYGKKKHTSTKRRARRRRDSLGNRLPASCESSTLYTGRQKSPFR